MKLKKKSADLICASGFQGSGRLQGEQRRPERPQPPTSHVCTSSNTFHVLKCSRFSPIPGFTWLCKKEKKPPPPQTHVVWTLFEAFMVSGRGDSAHPCVSEPPHPPPPPRWETESYSNASLAPLVKLVAIAITLSSSAGERWESVGELQASLLIKCFTERNHVFSPSPAFAIGAHA